MQSNARWSAAFAAPIDLELPKEGVKTMYLFILEGLEGLKNVKLGNEGVDDRIQYPKNHRDKHSGECAGSVLLQFDFK